MKALASNKYAQAAAVVATGATAAALVYVVTMTDGLDIRHTIKIVATAFLGPFAILSQVLPKITDLIVPQVRIVSNGPLAEAAPLAAAEQEVVTTQPATTVVVGAPPVPARARPPAVPPAGGRARAPAVPPESLPHETSTR